MATKLVVGNDGRKYRVNDTGSSVASAVKTVASSAQNAVDAGGKRVVETIRSGGFGGGSNKKTYDANTDYQSIINDAVARGDYVAAAQAEQSRNDKIKGEGLNYETTNLYGSYLNGGGGSSGGSSGGNSQYTTTNKIYNPNTDYQSYINDAVAKGDFATAAMYEQLRNQKIIGEGLGYELTNLYGSYLDGYNQQKNQQDALDMFNQYLQEWEQNNQKPADYESEYDSQMEALLSQILNRDDFSYDAMNDPLYQQYANMYQREGDRAMRNTLAEVATGAGGMNSYAITAAQQANNYYNSQLQDKIPELYQLAYEMYLNDKESKVQDLGILQNMDATQYNRYRDTINDYYNDKNFAYGVYQDAVNQGNWQTNFDYGSTWDKINYNTDNYWKNKEWTATESANEYNKNLYNQESAKEEVWKLIELGVTPSADLIERAGMSQDEVNRAVASVQAQYWAQGIPVGGGINSGIYTGMSGGLNGVISGLPSGEGTMTEFSPVVNPDVMTNMLLDPNGDGVINLFGEGSNYTPITQRDLWMMQQNVNNADDTETKATGSSTKKKNNVVEPEGDDMSDYTPANLHNKDWVAVAGFGRMMLKELESLVDQGLVEEIIDHNTKTVRYRKK